MKKLITIAMLLVAANSQASLFCDVVEKGIAVASTKISETFKCENADAVLEDLRIITTVDRRCSEDQEFAPTSLTCTVIAKSAAAALAGKIPLDWECDADQSKETIGSIVYKACEMITNRD